MSRSTKPRGGAAPAKSPRAAAVSQAPASSIADRSRLSFAVAAVVSLVALGVYIRTLAPSVPGGDSGEMITAAWVLGVPHPSGYPLFAMLGHLFTWLPFGSPAWRVNLMSAVFHALAVGTTALLIYRLIVDADQRMLENATRTAVASAAVGALALAFSAAFWAYALVAEVFAINSFFGALILFILLEWERRPTRVRLLWAFGLASGLAAADHQTIIFIAPACLVLLISGARQLVDRRVATVRFGRQLAITSGLLVVGLLAYLYLPIAASLDPPLNWGDPRTPAALLRHILRSDYGTFHLTVADRPQYGSPLEHIGLLLANLYRGFTAPGCLLAVAGLWWLWQRRPTACLALVLAWLSTGPGFVAFANPYIDGPVLYGVLERFYILPSVYVAVAIGLGVYQVTSWVTPRIAAPQRARFAPVVALALLAVPLAQLIITFSRVDQSQNLVEYHFANDLLAPMDRNALLITQGDVVTMGVDYVRLVEGARPDITTLDLEKLKIAAYVRQMRRQHPGLVIPFDSYVPGGDQMARLVDANLASRSVYLYANPKDPGFLDRYDILLVGLGSQFVPKGRGPDRYAVVAQKLNAFKRMSFPTRTFPDTTYEAGLVEAYGRLAFQIAYVLDDGVHAAEAAEFYRRSLQLDPKSPAAYMNLGLILSNRGAAPSEVVPLWEEFLRRAPDDPKAPAIRERLRVMGHPR